MMHRVLFVIIFGLKLCTRLFQLIQAFRGKVAQQELTQRYAILYTRNHNFQ